MARFASCSCSQVTIKVDTLISVPDKRHINRFFKGERLRATPLSQGSVSIKTIDDITTGTVEPNVSFVRCRNCCDQFFIITRATSTAVFPASWLEHEPGPISLSRSQSSLNLLPDEISSCFVVTDVRTSPEILAPDIFFVTSEPDIADSASDSDIDLMFGSGDHPIIGGYFPANLIEACT